MPHKVNRATGHRISPAHHRKGHGKRKLAYRNVALAPTDEAVKKFLQRLRRIDVRKFDELTQERIEAQGHAFKPIIPGRSLWSYMVQAWAEITGRLSNAGLLTSGPVQELDNVTPSRQLDTPLHEPSYVSIVGRSCEIKKKEIKALRIIGKNEREKIQLPAQKEWDDHLAKETVAAILDHLVEKAKDKLPDGPVCARLSHIKEVCAPLGSWCLQMYDMCVDSTDIPLIYPSLFVPPEDIDHWRVTQAALKALSQELDHLIHAHPHNMVSLLLGYTRNCPTRSGSNRSIMGHQAVNIPLEHLVSGLRGYGERLIQMIEGCQGGINTAVSSSAIFYIYRLQNPSVYFPEPENAQLDDSSPQEEEDNSGRSYVLASMGEDGRWIMHDVPILTTTPDVPSTEATPPSQSALLESMQRNLQGFRVFLNNREHRSFVAREAQGIFNRGARIASRWLENSQSSPDSPLEEAQQAAHLLKQLLTLRAIIDSQVRGARP